MTTLINYSGEGHQGSRPLGYECSRGYTFDFPSDNKHKEQAGDDIYHVLNDSNEHRRPCVLHADIPPIHGIKTEHCGCAPYNDVEILGNKRSGINRRIHRPNHKSEYKLLQNDKKQAYSNT